MNWKNNDIKERFNEKPAVLHVGTDCAWIINGAAQALIHADRSFLISIV